MFYSSITIDQVNNRMNHCIIQVMRPLHHPSRSEIKLTAVLYALSDITRLQIVRQILTRDELSCHAFEISTPKSTISHHFKVLRESGVTFTRVVGTQRFVSLRIEDLEARFPGLLDAIRVSSEPF